MEKYKKGQTKTINLKYLDQHGTENLNLMDHILHQIFRTILSISSKSIKNLLIILQ